MTSSRSWPRSGSSAHIVGHDWGRAVAWHLDAQHADRVACLTVLSTPHPRALARSMFRSLQPVRSRYTLAVQVPVLPEVILSRTLATTLRLSALRDPGTVPAPSSHVWGSHDSAHLTKTDPAESPSGSLSSDPSSGRALDDIACRREAGRVEWAVPALLGVVPRQDAT